MLKELIETGKTVDAAIDSACEKLGCKREECEWEIIDLPRKGFLGLKNNPAKVRVAIELPNEKPAEEKPVKQTKRQPEHAPPPREKQEKPEYSKKQKEQKTNPLNDNEISEKEKVAKEYLKSILTATGLNASFAITREHGGSCVNIAGEGLGMIIGRRGETLDAIQYLAGLVANRGGGDYVRFTIDCGEYRAKRRDTLEALARKLANQVLKTSASRTLEPMNPFERRIIHSTVYEIEGVSSLSVGEEPNRRVVITCPAAKPSARSGGFRKNGARDNTSERGRPPRRDARKRNESDGERPERRPYSDRGGRSGRAQTPTPQGPPKQTPEAEATTGMSFGKIDLE